MPWSSTLERMAFTLGPLHKGFPSLCQWNGHATPPPKAFLWPSSARGGLAFALR
ncbi:MAG: hypothetical protein FWG75_05745 [Cystobacterineae bacterium]|nr:hypothetical protein [Cystobacterineae bacterium]